MKKIINNKGFTLVELLTTLFIIAVISAIVLVNYRSSRGQLALKRSAFKLGQDLRRLEGMATGTEEFVGDVPESYAIHLNKTANSYEYILFADRDGDCTYDLAEAEELEINNFERDIYINFLAIYAPVETVPFKLADDATLVIAFKPPDPEIKICRDGVEDLATPASFIALTDGNIGKIVKVYKSGLIEIDPEVPPCVCTLWTDWVLGTCGGDGCSLSDPWEISATRTRECYDIDPGACAADPETYKESDLACFTDAYVWGPMVPLDARCCEDPPLTSVKTKRVATRRYDCLPCPGVVQDATCSVYNPLCTALPGECAVACYKINSPCIVIE